MEFVLDKHGLNIPSNIKNLKINVVVDVEKWMERRKYMSWFREREAYTEHMELREKGKIVYPVKYGTNEMKDHSKLLSDDLLVNQQLIDNLFYKFQSLLQNITLSLPQEIEIIFGENWLEYKANNFHKIGCYLPYKLIQDGKLLRDWRFLLTSLGNRGEPGSVYEDSFSRFLIIELKKQESTNTYYTATQYGFHRFLNAKYKKLIPEYPIKAIRGFSKNMKLKALEIIKKNFHLEISEDYVVLPEIIIDENKNQELLNFVKQLLIVGLVKEYVRGRFSELQLDS